MAVGRNPASDTRVVVAAALSTCVAMLPAFLLGGLAALARSDLGFGQAGLGLAVSVFFASSAGGSVLGGRIAERVGARRGLILGIFIGAMSLLVVGALSSTYWHLLACMGFAGVANGIIQPSANLALAHGVSIRRQGISFGIKQSAVLTAALVAGLAVPAVGLTVGWRWAFIGAGVSAIALIPGLPKTMIAARPRPRDARDRPRTRLRPLLIIALVGGCGAGAANSMGAFYVDSAIQNDQPVALAGLLLSFGSVCGIAGRLLGGWLADRHPGDMLRVVAGLLASGAGGLILLGVGRPTWVLVVGTVVGFFAGWGWPGLQHLVVVRENMDAPAAASGIVQAGTFTGGVLGPASFGWIAANRSYSLAWMSAAAVMFVGGLVLWVARFRQRPRQRIPTAC